jgi:predicted  nucleic acid-binding Zn-ribbon protein
MLRFGTFQISVATDKGNFGVRHSFEPGMNIIRAENSRGKSTVLASMVYAIGLEGAFSPSQDVPLPHVLTSYVDQAGGDAKVTESWVSLEITNGKGETATVSRAIVSPRDRRLITVRLGAALADPSSAGPSTDYFVRIHRSAVSDLGFHKFLTEFMGWSLPMAAQYDGEDSPLYIETLFPLLFVEQKLGWGRIPARFPTWLGVKDVRRRTVEFILKLDAYEIAAEKTAVMAELSRIRSAWSENRTVAGRRATALGTILNAIPTEPVPKWPPEVSPQILIASKGEQWEQLSEHLQRLRRRFSELQNQEIPAAGANDAEVRVALNEAESSVSEREMVLRRTLDNLESEISEANAIEERIKSLREDQRKYKDLLRLRELGSEGPVTVETDSCPTCHQPVSDSLLDMGKRALPMSVEQNIAFYNEQLQLFEAVFANAKAVSAASEAQVTSIRKELDEFRSRVRSLRETLTSPANTPSIEALTERIRLQERIASLEGLSDFWGEVLATFANLSDEWNSATARKAGLPKGSLSDNDEKKLGELQTTFQKQLRSYGFGSSDESRVTISRSDYEPELTDINLAADSAASDVIRLQWAYLLSLLNVGVVEPTNHPGFLIFDEPQQQSVSDANFLEMLKFAAAIPKSQVIVATSHEKLGIAALARKLDSVHLWELGDDRLISRVS